MRPELSVVLPIHNQADHITGLLSHYTRTFKKKNWEIILVPNACRDNSAELCRQMAARHPQLRVVESRRGGWGLSVYEGLQKARGKFLCYTNSARTDPRTILSLFKKFERNPKGLAKVYRRWRGDLLREGGSWLYNMECRWLLGLPTWDVNGTPKIFSAEIFHKFSIKSRGDFWDAELLSECRRLKIPVMEMPLKGWARHGGKSLMSLKSAWRLYGEPFRFFAQKGFKNRW
jgi:glycosyltransferase involved in cell wall biosynthesis